MEWPSSRVDKFAGGTITLGFGFLYVTDPISTHHWRAAIAFWIIGILIFFSGFPLVQRKLRIVWDEAVAFYKQVAIFNPYAAPICAGTLTMLMVALLFGGVWQGLSKSDPEPYLAVDSVNDPLKKQVESKPLRITEEEKMAMAQELREAGSFSTVILRLPDADSLSVADVLWVLREADWEVRDTVVVAEDEPMLGLFVLVPDSGDKPAGAEILARVFKKHNIDFTIRPRQDQGPGSFALLFGSPS